VVQSETEIDWIRLRRQIEDFAAQRRRPPTPRELKHFLAEHGVGPSMIDTFLAQVSSPVTPVRPSTAARPTPPRPAATVSVQPGEPVRSSGRPSAGVEDDERQHDDLDQTDDHRGQGVRPSSSRRVAEAVEDLVDDWHRQGGVLRRDQVVALTAKRKLGATELAEVDQQLQNLGIETDRASTPTESTSRRAERARQGHDDVLGAYLHEIGRHPLIGAEEEVRLGRAIHAGQRATLALAEAGGLTAGDVEHLEAAAAEGRAAHARLVEANLRLVVSIARQSRYGLTNTELVDRIQMGNEGLLHAADLFDPERGFKFSTYATWWIKQRIDRSIADTGRVIRLPVYVHERLHKIRRARRRLDEQLDREPTTTELADATGYTPGEVQAMLDYLTPVRSLQEAIGADTILLDLLAGRTDVDGRGDPQDHLLTAARRHELNEVLDVLLQPRERDILVRRYGLAGADPETLDTIGRAWNITRERVRQLEKKTFTLLRGSSSVAAMYDYLLDDTKLDRPRSPGSISHEPADTAGGSDTSSETGTATASPSRTGAQP